MLMTFIFFKGMLMGIADLVPGVSGGTIALITGVYQRLINAIASINVANVKLLFTGQLRQTWKQVDGWFLLTVFAGILSSVFLFASLFKFLLANHPVLTWSFFFGLIISSAIMLILQYKSSNLINWLFFLMGIGLGYVLSSQSMGYLPDGQVGVFIAGTIAISAMILPGISGSLILILLGKYHTLLAAVENREWLTLCIFAGGCVVGLMVFSRLLKWLLAHYHMVTIYTLAGLMVGTLFKVWPWKNAAINIWPSTQPEPQWLIALILMLAGAAFVLMLTQFDRNKESV